MAADHANNSLYSGYHNNQQFPVFCTDTAADKWWTKPQHRYHYVLHLFNAFKLYRYGYGNAMGVILAIAIAILSGIQFKMAKTD